MARVLASRMEIAAAAAGSVDPDLPADRNDVRGCAHRASEADPDNGPFCADRAAFQAYQAKVRSVTRPSSTASPKEGSDA